jgi:hypothetical protein
MTRGHNSSASPTTRQSAAAELVGDLPGADDSGAHAGQADEVPRLVEGDVLGGLVDEAQLDVGRGDGGEHLQGEAGEVDAALLDGSAGHVERRRRDQDDAHGPLPRPAGFIPATEAA